MFFGFLLQDYSIATLHALHQRNIESGGHRDRDRQREWDLQIFCSQKDV